MDLTLDTVAAIVLALIVIYALLAPAAQEWLQAIRSLPGYSVIHYLKIRSPLNEMVFDASKATRKMFEMYRMFGDCFRVPLGLYPSIATANPDDIFEIVSNRSAFGLPKGIHFTMSDAAVGNIFVLTGKDHRSLRKHLHDTFNSQLLPSFHAIMSECVLEGTAVLSRLSSGMKDHAWSSSPEGRKTYDAFTKNGYNDLARILSVITVKAITTVCFGTTLSPETRQAFLMDTECISNEMLADVFLHPLRKYVSTITTLVPFFSRRRFTQVRDRLRHDCKTFIEKRLKEKSQSVADKEDSQVSDLMDAILKIDSIDMELIISHTMTFALAGSLSTNQTIAWSIFELCKPENSDSYQKLQQEVDDLSRHLSADECLSFESVADLKFARAVWKETLRLHPPGYGFARMALKDTTLPGTGVRVRKGMHVQALSHMAQCDERYFYNAAAFRPMRWLDETDPDAKRRPPGAYLPFGVGPHNCAGRFFAEHEGVFVLAEVLRRFHLKLPCSPDQIVSCSGFVEVAKFASAGDGNLDMGVPIIATQRIWTIRTMFMSMHMSFALYITVETEGDKITEI